MRWYKNFEMSLTDGCYVLSKLKFFMGVITRQANFLQAFYTARDILANISFWVTDLVLVTLEISMTSILWSFWFSGGGGCYGCSCCGSCYSCSSGGSCSGYSGCGSGAKCQMARILVTGFVLVAVAFLQAFDAESSGNVTLLVFSATVSTLPTFDA